MRSLWKGALRFGLVHIPVRLYLATEEREIRFRQLHGPCGAPIRYAKRCTRCDAEVGPEEIVRGYEYAPNRYLPVTDEDLADLPIQTDRAVDIVAFVELAEIDPIYFARHYYLEPVEGGEKPYALLREAMREEGRVALAKVALRQRESLAAVRVFGDRALLLETMHYPDEVRPATQLAGLDPSPALGERELQMARHLIASLGEPFEPSAYRDEYRDALQARLESRLAGLPEERAARPETGRIADLMEALQRSIEAAERRRAGLGEEGRPATGQPAGG